MALQRFSRQLQPSDKRLELRHQGILYLLHNSFPYHSGGYAARAHGLLRGFSRAGWRVQAFARPGYPSDRGKPYAGRSKETIDGIDYNFLPEGVPFEGERLVEYVEQYAEHVIAAVDPAEIGYVQAASFYTNGFAGRRIADALGVPLVYEMRGLEWLTAGSKDSRWQQSEQALILRDLEIQAAKAADHVFAITGALRRWLIEQGVDAARISLLPNGCLTDAFKPATRDAELAARLGLDNAFVVGYIGSVVFYEGIELVAAAIKKARAQTGLDIRLLVVGDGPYYAQLKDELERIDAYKFTTLTGRVPHDEVPRYYSVVDTFTLARRDLMVCQYISPLKPFECMAMGKSIIASDVAAIDEILTESGGGVTFRADDVDHCSERIMELAAAPNLRAELERKGRDWVIEQRDWSILAMNALNELSGKYPRSRGLK